MIRPIVVDDQQTLSQEAERLVVEQLREKPHLLLGCATGQSPAGLYARLRDRFNTEAELFAKIRVAKIDEWGGLHRSDPRTCDSYLRRHLVEPLMIPHQRYTTFASDPADPAAEARWMNEVLARSGPWDVCVLGLGVNGHLLLNEPADALQPHAHVAELAETSEGHGMLEGGPKPTYGLTYGLADILASRLALLLVSGESKRDAVAQLLAGTVTPRCPATFLHLHPDLVCLVDRAALPE